MKRFLLIISVIMLMLVNMRSCALDRVQVAADQALHVAYMVPTLQEEVEVCLWRCTFDFPLKSSTFNLYAQEVIQHNTVLVQFTIDNEQLEDSLIMLQENIDVDALEFVITDKKNNTVRVQVCDGVVTLVPLQSEVAPPAIKDVQEPVVRNNHYSIDDSSRSISQAACNTAVVNTFYKPWKKNNFSAQPDTQIKSVSVRSEGGVAKENKQIVHSPPDKKVGMHSIASQTNSPTCVKSHEGHCDVKCFVDNNMIRQAADTLFTDTKLVTHELPCIAQLHSNVDEQKIVQVTKPPIMVEEGSQVEPVIQSAPIEVPAQKVATYPVVEQEQSPYSDRERSKTIHANQEIAMLRVMLETQIKQMEILTQQIEANSRTQQYANSMPDMVQEDIMIMLYNLIKRPDFGEYGIHSLLNLIDLEIDIVDYLRIDDKGSGFQDAINTRRTLFRRSMPSVQNAYSAVVDAAAQTASQKTNLSNKSRKQVGNVLAYALNSPDKQAFLQLMHNALAEYYTQFTIMRRNLIRNN